jgi:hypothetical protein
MLYDALKETGLRAEINRLKQQVDALTKQLVDLRTAFKAEVENNCEHDVSVHEAIVEIYDYLMPVVRKVFPGFAATQKQIRRVIGERASKRKKSS